MAVGLHRAVAPRLLGAVLAQWNLQSWRLNCLKRRRTQMRNLGKHPGAV